MSSIESLISTIEEDYHRILEAFEGHLTKEGYYRFEAISETDLLKLLREVMNFQRKIEYTVDFTIKLIKKDQYTKRLEEIAGELIKKLTTDEKIESTKFWQSADYRAPYNVDVRGIIPELRSSHSQLMHIEEAECRQSCYRAYFGFKSLHADLIELEEELRLIGALTTYPIEKKISLKHQLVLSDFEEVAVSLEEAESNVEPEHFKDCVSRCRDAIEIFVALIREKETGEKTEKHFATDLGKIVKIEVFDDSIQRLAQGVYSFMSIKGSHKYDASKVTVYDAETALGETYSLLEMLLRRYLELKKAKT